MREKDVAVAPKARKQQETELAHIPPHLRDTYRDLLKDKEAWAVAWNKWTIRGIRRIHHPACKQKDQALTSMLDPKKTIEYLCQTGLQLCVRATELHKETAEAKEDP